MHDVRVEIRRLAEEAKAFHAKDRTITLESVALIGEIVRRNVWVNLWMTSAEFAAFIGLTPNQFWKRVQAARVIRDYPEVLSMLKAGETFVSHVVIIAPKITQANSRALLDGIRGQTKKSVEQLASRISYDGHVSKLEPEIEIDVRLKLTRSQLASFELSRKSLSRQGRMPSIADVVRRAVEAFIVSAGDDGADLV